jgi:hypothetical protein
LAIVQSTYNVFKYYNRTTVLLKKVHTHTHTYIYIELINKVNYVRFEVFTAATMKNAVFWDINPQYVFHRRHITSPLQSLAS